VRESSIVGIEGSGGGFVGCGFAVTSRYILTCAHVVNAALGGRTGEDAQSWPLSELKISFPYLMKPGSFLTAKVVYWKPATYDVQKLPSANLGIEEDIAGLELLDLLPNIESVQLETAIEQAQFQIFGYPKKTPQGAGAEGKIQVLLPMGWCQLDGTCSQGLWAESGYSGGAVWAQQAGAVYGMVVAAKLRDDGSKIAFMIPSQKLQPAIATLQLLEALSCPQANLGDWPKIYQAAYQQCCPADWKLNGSAPKLLHEILAELQDMNGSATEIGDESVSHIVAFAARLAIHPKMSMEDLLQWGLEQSRNFVVLMDSLRMAEAEHQRQQAVAEPCLIFVVSSEKAPYKTEAFWLPDARNYDSENLQTYQKVDCWDFEKEKVAIADLPGCSLAELPDRLSGYLRTCVVKKLLKSRLRLEALLPLSLMNQPIEKWKLKFKKSDDGTFATTTPGIVYQVVIRCSQRAGEGYRESFQSDWQTYWDKVQAYSDGLSSLHIEEVSPSVEELQLTSSCQEPLILGFKLNGVPQPEFFKTLLLVAAPVAVWLRQSPSATMGQSSDDCQSALQWLDAFLLDCKVGNLPSHAKVARVAAIKHSPEPADSRFMVGHHLSLMWENPKLLPPLSTKNSSH
jgi:vWA-MoxR associated protein C-terminal domain/vWA-MoxR associated protein middle region (VMAP-M) 1/Trypsin-like peptidase domain